MRHPLDLPHVSTRPSAETLLHELDALAIRPSSFTAPSGSTESSSTQPGLARYLTSIISSPLAWIPEDVQREAIWEAASARLSERAGRSAMPSMSRTFEILEPQIGSTVSITLHEPSLTADQLGHKTWAASYLLAKRLASLRLPPLEGTRRCSSDPRPRILELGAGTGLVGLALATLFPVTVHLTDLPAIMPNLAANARHNALAIEARGSSVKAFGLDWANPPGPDQVPPQSYDVVVAADPIYGPEHPALLVGSIERYLSCAEGARAVIELPLREAYAPEVKELRERLGRAGIVLVEEGEEVGFDDWGEGSTEVRCWWSQWARETKRGVPGPRF